MNRIYKSLIYVALSTLSCAFLAIPANAQRTSGGGGGGSSSSPRPSGGGGGGSASSPRPSGGGGSSFSPRPSSNNVGVRQPNGNVGVARPNYNGQQRQNVYQQRPTGSTYRPGANYGYAPRVGSTAPRGTYTYAAPRVGISNGGGSVQSYRNSPAIGYGRGGYWGNHGYYHLNHGYYNSYYSPRLGFTCGFLPFGYYPFYYGDYQYFYSDGLYYQYDNSEYTVVEPPIGAQIEKLPANAQSIVINGQQYYELNGVYYQPVTKDDGTIVYQIAGKDGELNTNSSVQDDQPQGPQLGDIVAQLPPDCRKIRVSGEKLYVSPDGVYFQEQVDGSGNKTYKIVGLPTDEQGQN